MLMIGDGWVNADLNLKPDEIHTKVIGEINPLMTLLGDAPFGLTTHMKIRQSKITT